MNGPQEELSEECDRVHAEERLEQSCNDQLTLDTHGNDGGKCHNDRVTRSFLEKEYQSIASQTQTCNMVHCNDEPYPPWLEEMEQAKASIASRDMEIIDWTVRANEAMEDAQRSKKLASQRQEEINTLNKRYQVRFAIVFSTQMNAIARRSNSPVMGLEQGK